MTRNLRLTALTHAADGRRLRVGSLGTYDACDLCVIPAEYLALLSDGLYGDVDLRATGEGVA